MLQDRLPGTVINSSFTVPLFQKVKNFLSTTRDDNQNCHPATMADDEKPPLPDHKRHLDYDDLLIEELLPRMWQVKVINPDARDIMHKWHYTLQLWADTQTGPR